MRNTTLMLLTVFGLSLFLWAQQQPAGFTGFPGSRNIVLTQQARVGNQVLPAGTYQVTHVMEGTEHIMIFKQYKKEFRVKCNLEPLTGKAQATMYYYGNDGGQRVLQSIVFQGDNYRHVFAR